ncbi:MAG: GntR family transcriptional regulator [Chloroflexi bacterium]|nr:GntR family transcriptional regulator [Chloroflexota bacterium]
MPDASLAPPREGPQTKTDYAVNALRQMVRRGELQPGTRINVGELARQLDISPTPVREAVRLLQAEGMLVYSPHRGARVADILATELDDTYRIRKALEGLATEMAAERLTDDELAYLRSLHNQMAAAVEAGHREVLRGLNDEFHLVIYRGARSERLLRLIVTVWHRAPGDTFMVIPERGIRSVREHEPILAALERRAVDEAAASMCEHIQRSLELIRPWSAGGQLSQHTRAPIEDGRAS